MSLSPACTAGAAIAPSVSEALHAPPSACGAASSALGGVFREGGPPESLVGTSETMITLKRLGLRTHVVSLHEDTGSGSQLDLVEDIFGLVTNFDFSALFLLRNYILLASLQFDNRDGDVPRRWSHRGRRWGEREGGQLLSGRRLA